MQSPESGSKSLYGIWKPSRVWKALNDLVLKGGRVSQGNKPSGCRANPEVIKYRGSRSLFQPPSSADRQHMTRRKAIDLIGFIECLAMPQNLTGAYF